MSNLNDTANYNYGFADGKDEARNIVHELIQLAWDGICCQGLQRETETIDRIEARLKEIATEWNLVFQPNG